MPKARKRYPELRDRQEDSPGRGVIDSQNAPPWADGVVVFLVFLSVYLFASLYTELAGSWGKAAGRGLLESAGEPFLSSSVSCFIVPSCTFSEGP